MYYKDSYYGRYAAIDEEYHTFYGSISHWPKCTQCKMYIESEDSIDEYSYGVKKLAHNFANGVCLDCGYERTQSAEGGMIVLNANALCVVKGMEIPLEAEIHLGEAAEIEYASSNENVAVVDSNGMVETVGYGDAVITVSAEGSESTECEIHVLEAIRLPDAVTMLGESSFEANAMVAIDLSGNDGLEIGDGTFAKCGALKCVLLPENVEFGEDVFDSGSDVRLYCWNEKQMRYAQDNGIDWFMLG